ncbi:hypothetical protein [Colwellia sp. MB02u-14]|uniref:hypothetical protein n=1 Tax=Colwellia sp. MB02u-14 TaxID=2759815 RepID=UPI0015F3DBAF|nr:hypothetical protein [Colwellia sp. MB02u-14]MBA6304205.1 hypothetical protein [Colwellia sp. MB02u-14]
MLDLSKSYTYTGDGDLQYSYYPDYQDPNQFYIEPQIIISVDPDTKLPIFKAVQYNTSDSYNGSGYCTFTVELAVPNNVINLIISDIKKQGLSSNPNISQLQYLDGGTAVFSYPSPTDPSKNLNVQAISSALGENRASFLCQFGPEEMKNFVATYSKKGEKGWPVQYFEKVNGVTPAVTVEINFDASIVRDYQDKVTHNTWKKNTHDITDTVTQNMPKGKNFVVVTPGAPAPSEDVMDAMKVWGQAQLDAQITKMVEEGQRLKADKSPATWFYSFHRKFQENQVIPWHINPVSQLPSPVNDSAPWSTLFSTVDLRHFTLLVSMNVDDRKLPNADKVKSITVNVDYPTLNAPNNSVVLTPTNASHMFESPIAEGGNLEYNWSYLVTYNDNTQLKVERSNQKDSTITISAPDVGILNVEFNTSQIPFMNKEDANGETAVHGLEVDFFYKDLSGQNNPLMQNILFGFPTAEKDADGHPVYQHDLTYNFVSKTTKPIYNGYIYTSKFRMTDGTELVSDPVDSNANIVMGDTPAADSTVSRDNIIYLQSAIAQVQYTLMYLPTEDSEVLLFNAKVNEVQGDGQEKFVGQAEMRPTDSKSLTSIFTTTTLNPSNQPYNVSGNMVTQKGPILIPSFVTSDTFLPLYDGKRYFSVTVDPSLLKFEEDGLAQVQFDVAETASGPLRAKQFKSGVPIKQYWYYSHDATDSPSYYCEVTYSYTNRPPVKVTYSDQTVNIFTIPAVPENVG